ncbi:unnamed protein product [Amoebophrya sp. A120]|nr:unnamed protein product [Amoebophrya sp. A120]|eukprot:GSA120T00000188001.1
MSHLASTAASSSWRDYCAVEEKLALSETKVRELEIELRESKMQHEQEQASLQREVRTLRHTLGCRNSEEAYRVTDLRDEITNLERRNFELRMQKEALESECVDYLARLEVSEEERAKFDGMHEDIEAEFVELWQEKCEDVKALQHDKRRLQDKVFAAETAQEKQLLEQSLEASEDLAKLREQYSLKFDYLEKQLVEVTEAKQELELSLVDAKAEKQLAQDEARQNKLMAEEQADENMQLKNLLYEERDRRMQVVEELKEEYNAIMKSRASQYLQDMDVFSKIQDRLMKDLTTERLESDQKLLHITDRVKLEQDVMEQKKDQLEREEVGLNIAVQTLYSSLLNLLKKYSSSTATIAGGLLLAKNLSSSSTSAASSSAVSSSSATTDGEEESDFDISKEQFARTLSALTEDDLDDTATVIENLRSVVVPRISQMLESAIQKENVNTELVCARACLQELEDENSSLQDENSLLQRQNLELDLDNRSLERRLEQLSTGEDLSNSSAITSFSDQVDDYVFRQQMNEFMLRKDDKLEPERTSSSSTTTLTRMNPYNNSRGGGGAASRSGNYTIGASTRNYINPVPAFTTRAASKNTMTAAGVEDGSGTTASKTAGTSIPASNNPFSKNRIGGVEIVTKKTSPNDDVSTTLEEDEYSYSANDSSSSWVEKKYEQFHRKNNWMDQRYHGSLNSRDQHHIGVY